MKNILPKTLFYYCFAASIFVIISSVISARKIEETIFSFLFLPVGAYFVTEFFFRLRSEKNKENTPLNKDGLIASIVFFGILLSLAIYGLYRNSIKNGNTQNTYRPDPLMLQSGKKPSPLPEYKKVTVRINDGSETINIRKKPTIYSEKIGEAKEGDIFDSFEKTGEWYKIIFNEQQIGYISFKYIAEKE